MQRSLVIFLTLGVVVAGCLRLRCIASDVFVRGDADGDGQLGVSDAICILKAVVERSSLSCPDAADYSDNGLVQLGDAALLIEYLLKGAPDPNPPFPGSGPDPTADGLGCERLGAPPIPIEGQAIYSLSVLPTLGGRPGFRLRVEVASPVDLLAGRLALTLPEGWSEDARVLDVRPSLQTAPHLASDGLTAARIGTDRKLRCLWLLSRSDFTQGLPGGGVTPIFDVTVCPGKTPTGTYTLQGEAEAVTNGGIPVNASIESVLVEHTGEPVECPQRVEEVGSMRPYLWLTDARAEPGQAFRVSLWSTASFDVRQFGFRLTWDPDVLRIVGAESIQQQWIFGTLINFDGFDPQAKYEHVQHVIIPCRQPECDGLSMCHPCSGRRSEAPRAVVRTRNYIPGFEERRPFFADIEFHHVDLIFQVLADANPGETFIDFIEDTSTGREDNYAEPFRYENHTEDEIRYLARPLIPARVEILPSTGLRLFIRGDANADGIVGLSDAVTTLLRLFHGFLAVQECEDASDSNDDGRIDLTDPVFTLGYLFLGGSLIPAPYPVPGTDSTHDDLACDK